MAFLDVGPHTAASGSLCCLASVTQALLFTSRTRDTEARLPSRKRIDRRYADCATQPISESGSPLRAVPSVAISYISAEKANVPQSIAFLIVEAPGCPLAIVPTAQWGPRRCSLRGRRSRESGHPAADGPDGTRQQSLRWDTTWPHSTSRGCCSGLPLASAPAEAADEPRGAPLLCPCLRRSTATRPIRSTGRALAWCRAALRHLAATLTTSERIGLRAEEGESHSPPISFSRPS
jgi:hypothetical protein